MGAADAAGADMGQFTQALNQHLQSAGGNVVGAALGAADAAGADMGQFSNQLSTAMANAPQQAQQAVQQGAQGAQQTVQSLGIQGPTANTPGDLIDQTRQAAINAGIDPDIFARQIQQESGFNPQAGSSAGAQGIAQFMPATAKQYGVNPWDPTSALPGAAKMMSNLLDQYGGDWSKALAAYNGGDKAVQQLNAGQPWQETQQYLNTILGGAKNVIQGAQQGAQNAADTGLQAVNTASDTAQAAAARTSQFAMGLSSGDAMAFCGPAAAMAFAETFGRNPTVDEAKQLAAQVGWNPGQGMAGPSSEVSLLNKLGIATHMSQGVDWSQVAGDASSGNPVIIDTPGHYFYVDGYNSDTGQFHLGTSATDLKAAQGKEWFTPSQIPGLGMGDPRAAIFADHPLSGAGVANAVGGTAQQALSTAQQTAGGLSQQAQDTMSAVLDTGSQTAQDATSGASNWLDSQKAKLSSGLSDVTGGAQDVLNQAQQAGGGDIQSLLDAAQQAGYDTTGLRNQMPDVSSKAQDLVQTAQSSGQDLSSLIQQAPDQAAQIVQQAGYDVSGLLGQAGQGAQQDLLGAATSPLGQQLMQAAVENAQGGPSLLPAGSLDLYRQANALKNQAIAQNNPIGNANVAGLPVGALSTMLAQGITDPTLLALLPFGSAAAAPVADLLGGGALGTIGMRAAEGALIGGGTSGAEGGNVQDVLTSALGGGLLGGGAGAVGSAAGPLLSRALGGLDILSRPELAYASTRLPGESADAYAARLAQEVPFGAGGQPATTGAGQLQQALQALSAYPEEQIGQVRQLATAASEAGAAPASEIAGMLQQWMRENPVSSEAIQAVTNAVTGAPPRTAAEAGAPATAAERAVAGTPLYQQIAERYAANPTADINDIAQTRQAINAAQAIEANVSPAQAPWSDVFARAGNALPSAQPFAEATAGPAAEALPTGFLKAGIRPDTMQTAYERIDQALGAGSPQAQAAQDTLDQLIRTGNPGEGSRFLTADVEGKPPSLLDWLQTERTGSMAGGATNTEATVALSPLMQIATRGTIGALSALAKGRPGDIGAGLGGVMDNLAETTGLALQGMRYGTNWESALTGGAQGTYGFRPGPDVIAATPLQRAIAAGLQGFVRTHGVLADISAGIGRGGALGQGATPEEAAKVGAQWAARGGQYGTTGKLISNIIQEVKQTNPALNVAGQVLLPFFRRAYNVGTFGTEISPVGVLGTAADVARARLPESAPAFLRGPYASGQVNEAVTPVNQRVARNLFGIGLAGIGMAEAQQGNITGSRPQGGAPANSIRLAGYWVPLKFLGPAAEPLAQSTSLYEGMRDGHGDIGQTAKLTAASYIGHVYDESWIRNFQDVLGMVGDVKNMGGAYAPAAAAAQKDLGYQASQLGESFIPQSKLGGQFKNFVTSLGAPTGGAATAPQPRVVSPARVITPPAKVISPARVITPPPAKVS
jgi:hypothetical protein